MQRKCCLHTLKFITISLLSLVLLFVMTASSAPVTLRFHYREGQAARADTVKAWIADFESKHPNIKVTWEPATDFSDQLIVSLAAGTGPDVIEMLGTRAQDLAVQGAFMDLRPYVKRDFTQKDVEDFFPSLWDASFIKFGPNMGAQMSIPRYTTTTAFYYNQSLFAAAGLVNPRELERANIWNWDTLRQAAKKLTIMQDDKVIQRGLSVQSLSDDRFPQWLQAAGGDMFDLKDPTRFIGDQPQAVAGANFLQDLIWKDNSTSIGERDLFSQGKVGMLDEGMHALFERFEVQIQNRFEWDVVRRPNGPAGQAAFVSYDAFSISAATKHPNEAWEFLKYLVSREGQELNIEYQGLPPSRRTAAQAYMRLSANRNLQAYLQNAIVSTPPLSMRIVGDVTKIMSAMNSAVTASIRKNQKSYQQAIGETKPVIEALIAEGQKTQAKP